MAVFDEETPGWAKALAAAAVAVVVVLIAVIVTLVVVLGDDDESQGSPAAPPSTSSTSSAKSSSTCGLRDGKQVIPTEGPSARWEVVSGFAAPSSSSIGPGLHKADIHSCFARNPSGALFAAVWMLADERVADTDSNAWAARYVPDANSKEFLARDESDSKGKFEYQAAGFRIASSFDGTNASVTLALRSTSTSTAGALIAIVIELRWHEGDWRVFIADAALENPFQVSQLESLSGFTEWGEL